jgi:hypothetical protein
MIFCVSGLMVGLQLDKAVSTPESSEAIGKPLSRFLKNSVFTANGIFASSPWHPI